MQTRRQHAALSNVTQPNGGDAGQIARLLKAAETERTGA